MSVATPAASAQLVSSSDLSCLLRLPLPDAASAAVLAAVINADPFIDGTTRTVACCPAGRTRETGRELVGGEKHNGAVVVEVRVDGRGVRPMRAAVGAVLEQAKLCVRTMRVFPPERRGE